MKADAYLFGQVLGTHSFLLRGGFLQPDAYSEIDAQYFLPGGETGTACTVLSSLGVNVRMAGTDIGTKVAPMLKEFYKDKTVIVVGGGNSAVSDALYLSRLAKKVYLVHRRDTLRATRIYHDPLLKADNVEFLWDSAITEILYESRVSGATVTNLKSGETAVIHCDGIFVSIGRVPAAAFLDGAVAQDQHGYIIAGEDTKTSIPGVFAAGDIRTKDLRQVVTAVADGAVAALAACDYVDTKNC